jgi:hypothetical protein
MIIRNVTPLGIFPRVLAKMIISGLVTSSQRSGLSRPNRPAATGPFQIVEASRIRDRASLRDCRNRRTGDWAANVCGERRDDAGVGLVSLDSMGRSDRALVNFKSIHASRKPATRVTPLSGGLNARKRIPHHMGGPLMGPPVIGAQLAKTRAYLRQRATHVLASARPASSGFF